MGGSENGQEKAAPDNYGNAAGQMAKLLKSTGQKAVNKTVSEGMKAGANTAAATVKAGMESGKTVAKIAAGTAAGGPWGALLSAAWSLKNTLFKVLVCVCLTVVFLTVLIVSLPSIVADQVFGLNGTKPVQGTTLMTSYTEMADVISDVINDGYEQSLADVEEIIKDGGYDYELSMDALINYAQSSADYDVGYILSAYSASLGQKGTSKADMEAKLSKVADKMFPVTTVEKMEERPVPVSYLTYRPVTVKLVTKAILTGIVNGVPQFRYEFDYGTYYLPDVEKYTDTEIKTDAFKEVTLITPVYTGVQVSGIQTETYYEPNGEITVLPGTEEIPYVECTIHPFDESVILDAFGIDPDALYDRFGVTYAEAIKNMANALKRTLYGELNAGQAVPLTDEEMIAFINRQGCGEKRKSLLTTALSLVGRVPYFWGGKSAPGWNDEWNTPKVVTAAGSSSSGTIRPYGLDCSGFTDWVYQTALGMSIGTGSADQWDNSTAITQQELIPGDLGFLQAPSEPSTNHVLIYAGLGDDGEQMWVHCDSGRGVILDAPTYVTYYRRLPGVE